PHRSDDLPPFRREQFCGSPTQARGTARDEDCFLLVAAHINLQEFLPIVPKRQEMEPRACPWGPISLVSAFRTPSLVGSSLLYVCASWVTICHHVIHTSKTSFVLD